MEKYTYDAFGQPTVTNWDGSGARTWSNYGNRFMFTGREWLAALGLYDYRARMYQPQLGRFLQPDPLGFGGGDPNLFRYCAGDPVNRSDPSGLVSNQKQPNSPPTLYRPNEPKMGPAPGSIQGISILGGWTAPDGIPTGGGTGLSNSIAAVGGGYGSGSSGSGAGVGPSAGSSSANSGGSNVPGYAVFYSSDRVIVAAGAAMSFVAGELGFSPGTLVFDGNGHVNSSTGTWTRPAPSASPAGFSGNFVAAFRHEFASYNLTPLANGFERFAQAYTAIALGGLVGGEFAAIPELFEVQPSLSSLEIEAIQDAFVNGLTQKASAQIQGILADSLSRQGVPASEILRMLNGF
ncbi:MAG: RHS repeat-associated core domain-containing protein [Chthoniobacterales bacterium]